MSQFIECVREAQQNIFSSEFQCLIFSILMVYLFCVSQRQLVSGLIIFTMCKCMLYKVPYYNLQQIFVFHPLVLFLHYKVPLLLVCVVCSKQFLQVLCDFLSSVHNLYFFSPFTIFSSERAIPQKNAKGGKIRFAPLPPSCTTALYQILSKCKT